MKESDRKYIDNNLDIDELKHYRKEVNNASEKELEERLFKVWEENCFDCNVVSEEQLNKIKQKIDKNLFKRKKHIFLQNLWKFAAVILLSFLIYHNFILSSEKSMIANNEIVITTSNNEKVNITLPDGTLVTLNENSQLIYKGGSFNKEMRQVQFEGEGYFAVAKKAKCPFSIETNTLDINVLGTKFYLKDRNNIRQTELILDEGKIRVKSRLNDKFVILEKGHKVMWNYNTHQFIIEGTNLKGQKVLQNSILHFKEANFLDVIKALEERYQVEIVVNDNPLQKYAFSGTLPADNLLEALKILGKIYYLSTTITNGNIYLYSHLNKDNIK